MQIIKIKYFLLAVVCFEFAYLDCLANEFSLPRSYSSLDSNIGQQQIVTVSRIWVGDSPQHIAPGSIPLGSLANRKYIISDPYENEFFDEIHDKPYDQNDNVEPTFSHRTNSEALKSFPDKSSLNWVGPKPDALAPGIIPLGSLATTFIREIYSEEKESSDTVALEDSSLLLSYFSNIRPVYNSNVLQLEDDAVGTALLETSFGVSSMLPVEFGSYVTMIPKVDFLVQNGLYIEKDIVDPDSLNYIYSMVKGGLSFEFGGTFSLSPAVEFGFSNSLRNFNKQFDSIVPSLQLSNIFISGDSSLLIFDAMIRRSLIKGQKPLQEDEDDNLQIGLSLNFIKIFGDEEQFMLLNSIGLSRSNFLKYDYDGRIDWLAYSSINFSWKILKWLNFDLGTRYSNRWVNTKGQSLGISEYDSFETSMSFTASNAF